MRQVLVLALVLLVLSVLVSLLGGSGQARESASAGAGVDVLAIGQGSGLPPAVLGTGPERVPHAILIDDFNLVSTGAPDGLRVATLSAKLELIDHRLFDVAHSEQDAAEFRQHLRTLEVGSVLVIASTGEIQPIGPRAELARAALSEVIAQLGSQARPFEKTPTSWALITVRRASGWVPLAEAADGTRGVCLAFSLHPNLAIYDKHQAERVLGAQVR